MTFSFIIVLNVFDRKKRVNWNRNVPSTQLTEIKDREVPGQDDDERLLVILSERLVGPVLVGDEVPLRPGPVPLPHPEVRVRRLAVVAERGDEERLRIHYDDSEKEFILKPTS